MANLRAIRRRINSIKSTQQITRAMKMVAASKLRLAQTRVERTRPYAISLREVIKRVSSAVIATNGDNGKFVHPLLTMPDKDSPRCFIVISSDRGLCGSFNVNLLKFSEIHINPCISKGDEVTICAVGKRSLDYFRRRQRNVDKQYLGITTSPNYANALLIAEEIIDCFLKQKLVSIDLIFTRYFSAISYTPQLVRLLPVVGVGEIERNIGDSNDVKLLFEYIFEPNSKEVLDSLLPRYVAVIIYQALLESSASEHAARMMAMDNATKNASDMIERLTLDLNKTRQAIVTRELAEIVGGKEAVEA